MAYFGAEFPTPPSYEARPVGGRRWANQLLSWLKRGVDDQQPVDLRGHNVRLDGHWVTDVSADVARDLLDRPFTSVAEQAAMLSRILRWARDMGGYYEVGVIRTRFMGAYDRGAAASRAQQQHNGDHWLVHWWYEE